MSTLTTAQLNRATLARQFLLERTSADVGVVIDHLIGLQTQIPTNHYLSLWTRITDFDPKAFSQRFADGEFVRIALQRSTIHTVTARDAAELRALFDTLYRRMLRGNYGKLLEGLEIEEIAAAARELLEAEPRTSAALGKALQERWPERDQRALAMVGRQLLALVQLPPRGEWGVGQPVPVLTTTKRFIASDPNPEPDIDSVVMRYFAAFGPASVADVQMFFGLTRLREVVQRHSHELVTFRDEDGVELFDLPEAPRPPADTPTPVRFLPEFDNIFIGHKDRRRVVEPAVAAIDFWAGGGQHPPLFMADGVIAGWWRLRDDVLRLKPLRALTKVRRHEVEAEGRAMAAAFGEPVSDTVWVADEEPI